MGDVARFWEGGEEGGEGARVCEGRKGWGLRDGNEAEDTRGKTACAKNLQLVRAGTRRHLQHEGTFGNPAVSCVFWFGEAGQQPTILTLQAGYSSTPWSQPCQ